MVEVWKRPKCIRGRDECVGKAVTVAILAQGNHRVMRSRNPFFDSGLFCKRFKSTVDLFTVELLCLYCSSGWV